MSSSRSSVYDLDFYLINSRSPSAVDISKCEEAYLFWKRSWIKTYSRLGVEKGHFFSNDFLDQEISGLFYQGQPIALFFHNYFDISRVSILEHSYFKNHPPEVVQTLKERCLGPMMCLNHMTVHPQWRSVDVGLSMPDLLFSLSIKRFQQLKIKFLSGYIRTDKSFYMSFYRHGAVKISSSICYNVPVDFCYLMQDQSQLSESPGVAEACLFLWNKNKIERSEELVTKEEIAL